MTEHFDGGCLCGAIRYRLDGVFTDFPDVAVKTFGPVPTR